MIRFHYSYPSFRISSATKIKTWLFKTATAEKKKIQTVDFIFVSDTALLEINKRSLHHDYFTDILSFAYSYHPIEGELYISVDRIREHSIKYKVRFNQELHRVMVHGLLHLCGYKDNTWKNRENMTRLEDKYLRKL